MPLLPARVNKLHLKLPANTKGIDFVVGDIHGCYDRFMEHLVDLEFDETVDRVFSVGDLVDRGQKSWEALQLIYKPWFYAVLANHEGMMIESVLRDDRNMHWTWASNGGSWARAVDAGELAAVCKDVDNLPYIITVGEGVGKFHVVHAEIKHFGEEGYREPVTDMMIDNWVFSDDEEWDMLWGRTIATSAHPTYDPAKVYQDPDKMSRTFCGHTPMPTPMVIQNQVFLDTGAVFGSPMTFAVPSENMLYSIGVSGNINKIPIDSMHRHG